MKMAHFWRVVFVSLLLLNVVAFSRPAWSRQIPRVTNIVVLVDFSSSMFEKSASSGSSKSAHAKNILRQMSDMIPEIGYTVAMPLDADAKQVIGPQPFEQESFREMIAALPDKAPSATVGRAVSLATAIRQLPSVLLKLDGKTSVIILSDGRTEGGADPVEAAQQVWGEEPSICFDVISLADTDSGRTRLKEVAGVSNCVYTEGRRMLTDTAAIKRFVQNVFFLQVPEQPSRKDLAALKIRPDFDTALVVSQAPPFEFILFDSKSARIDQQEMPYLVMNAVILKSMPDLHVRIEGHTDTSGKWNYNRRLSKKRAQAVYNELVRRGIRAERMKVIGYGESIPALSNLTPSGRSLNRRVEIVVDE
jgi:OOP family OmpA-OmpF porin